MSEKTNAETVAEMQRKISAAEMALYHLCHLETEVKFFTRRRDGRTIYVAGFGTFGDDVAGSSFDESSKEDTALDFLKRIGDAAFQKHIENCEKRNGQR